jgi:hypothetical protein
MSLGERLGIMGDRVIFGVVAGVVVLVLDELADAEGAAVGGRGGREDIDATGACGGGGGGSGVDEATEEAGLL